jgi:hypothetical protein
MASKKFIISDETENRHGFIFLNTSLDFSAFNKNPVCLFMHEDESTIIGSWSPPILEEIDGRECWTSELTFDSEDEAVKPIEGKVMRGFLRAVSLGAIIKGGLEKKGEQFFAKKGIVHEISLVNIGSNGNAVKLYHTDGKVMNESEVKLSLNLGEDNQNQNNHMKELKDVAVTLGLTESATAQEISETIVNLRAEIGFKQKFEDLEKKVSADKEKAFVDSVELKIAQNALSSTKKDYFVKLYAVSPELAEQGLADFEAPKDLTAVAGAGTGSVVTLAIEYDNLEKTDGLVKLMASNPIHFKEIYKAKFGVEPEL